MPSLKSSTTKIPKYGWVQELEDAESAAKKNRSAGAQLRLAIAAYKLREFKRLKIVANLGLALDPSEGEKELLKEYIEKSKERKEMTIENNIILLNMRFDGSYCDSLVFSSATVLFTNLNILQHAVMNGDIALMEEVVALGAALDFPVQNKNPPGVPPSPAPPGSTALLLACAFLAMVGEMERRHPNYYRRQNFDTIDRNCECAIQLVHLGANCQVKLQIPAQRPDAPVNQEDPVDTFRIYNFDGKTAQELAHISGRRELIRAIELMQKTENVHLTQCRCGSRLPWDQCHGAPIPGQSDLRIKNDNGRMRWRYSPKALCPCYLTNEEYYKCCWFTSTPSYKNDTNGAVIKIVKAPPGRHATKALRELQYMTIFEIMDPNDPSIPQGQGTTLEEYRSTQTDLIRSEGLSFLDDFNGRRCGVQDWDSMVYAGVVDRIDNFFVWNDLHWLLTKVELLQRTKEWNEALEKYCDDVGLTGAERQAVVQKHTANPCAPCSNPSCKNWEKVPKEFKSCSGCKSVAYCSRDCQKKDWKAQHKSKWCVAT
jgi:hypothetical protein